MSDSDELFTLRQHFFTGEYTEVTSISPSDYTGPAYLSALEYKLRALIILGQFSEAQNELSASDAEEPFKKTIAAYITLAKGGDASSEFESLIIEHKDKSYVQVLGGIFLVKAGRADEAIKHLQRHESSLEAVLLIVQLLLAQGKVELAEKEITSASAYAQDSIIFNLAEGYLNAAKNGTNLKGSLYFFEELSHAHPTYKTLLSQLVLNLQLKEWNDAEEVLEKLEALEGTNADLIANQYAFANIKCDETGAESKLKQLEKLSPDHPVVVDHKQKNELFDSIVEKYKDQVVA